MKLLGSVLAGMALVASAAAAPAPVPQDSNAPVVSIYPYPGYRGRNVNVPADGSTCGTNQPRIASIDFPPQGIQCDLYATSGYTGYSYDIYSSESDPDGRYRSVRCTVLDAEDA